MATRNRTTRTRSKAAATRSAKGRGGRIRDAVVGQGYISQVAVLPAFAHARRNSELGALVSDDPEKLRVLGKRYGVDRLHTYDAFDECLASDAIDAVFIAPAGRARALRPAAAPEPRAGDPPPARRGAGAGGREEPAPRGLILRP